jgi:hypothetical protein
MSKKENWRNLCDTPVAGISLSLERKIDKLTSKQRKEKGRMKYE